MKNPELQIIDALYEELLGRTADEVGRADKLSMLNNGTASIKDIIRGILASEEFRTKLPLLTNKLGIDAPPFINSVSQFGEIELLMNHWVNNLTTAPIVVDAGARGKDRSNSWDLLNSFGWRGLLIEANAMLIPQIERDFAGLHYKLINCAVSNYTGEAEFTLGNNDDISSLNAKAAESWGATKGTVKVQVRKLQTLLHEEKIPYNFCLLSLDIEGEDVKVLNDLIELSMYRPSYIIIEASYDFSTKSLNDIPVTEKVKRSYQIIGQTKANLILKLKEL
jgi:FkbM family methyltransferase